MDAKLYVVISLISYLCLTGCAIAPLAENTSAVQEKKLTLGVAQKEIKEGMSQADVAMELGSPNIVTKDKNGVETWIYDRFSSEIATTSTSAGIASLILTPMSGTMAGISGRQSNISTTQRTLTIIIKFKNELVSEFTYHSSAF